MSDENPIIQVSNIHKHFGKLHALNGVSTHVDRGEVLRALLEAIA